MSELFDTTNVPDDPQYWDAMTTRVVAAVTSVRSPSLLDWLATSRIAWLAASIVLAAVAIVMWVPETAVQARREWTPLFAPADAVGRMMTVADRPPDIELLLDDRLGSIR